MAKKRSFCFEFSEETECEVFEKVILWLMEAAKWYWLYFYLLLIIFVNISLLLIEQIILIINNFDVEPYYVWNIIANHIMHKTVINISTLLNQHKSTISTIPDINSCLSYTLTHGTQANKLTTKLKMHRKYLYLSSKQADMNKLEHVKRLSLQSLSKSDNEYAQRLSSVISR